MTRKMQLCIRAAAVLRNADHCRGKQFVVLFGRDLCNSDEHRIGKLSESVYRIDDQLYSQSMAMTLVKAYLDDGAYTFTDVDYLRMVSDIVAGNTSSSGEFWSVDASQDCDNHPEVAESMGKSSDDLFEDVLLLAIRQGREVLV